MRYLPKFGFYIAHETGPARRRLYVRYTEAHASWVPWALHETDGWVSLSPYTDPAWYPTVDHALPDLERMSGRYGTSARIFIIDCNTHEPVDVDEVAV